MTLHFSVDGPPRGKGRPRITTRGGFPRAYMDEKTRAYEEQIAWAAKAAGAQPLELPCTVVVTAVMPIPPSWSAKRKQAALAGHHVAKPDCDNILKCLDALNGVAWKDDAQIFWANVKKVYGERPRLDVTITYPDIPSTPPPPSCT